MVKVALTIDGKKIDVDKGMTILEAALANDIYIPHLCYHPDLEPVGVCRLCMVEVEGKGLIISCKTPAEEGMVIKVNNPDIDNIRKVAIKLILINNTDGKNIPNKLKEAADYIGIQDKDLRELRRHIKKIKTDDSNPFFERDLNKCILCGICIRTCDEIEGVNAIDFSFRGYDTTISTFGNIPIKDSVCESCGECVVRCPTEALALKKFEKPDKEVRTICPYCGVGCGIILGVKDNKIVCSQGDMNNPVNKGILCVKGRFGHEFVNHPDRLAKPLIKKKGKFVEASWEEALILVAERFSKYKGNQFAVMTSAKCSNEENYLLQKFARAVMGTNNVDHCARLCHAPTVAGLVQSLGSGAMTNSINEILNTKTIFAIGTNTTEAHPVIALKMIKARKNGAKLIVANPKRIDLCKHADIFLQHNPGTDAALMMGMMKVIVDEKLYDEKFIKERCENFADFKKSLELFDADFVEKVTGVPNDELIEAARVYATNKPAGLFYAMGITQHSHGTDNVLATSNMALLTGNIAKPSTGVNPLRGQNNVQGACDMGALPNVYPGYQKVEDQELQKKFEKAWSCNVSTSNGLALTEMWDAILDGRLKAIYLVGENSVLSEADSTHVRKALEKADFSVVQDIFLTETAEYADVVLPAVSFAEKDGTFTNTERRVQRIRKAIEAIGDAKPDWEITCDIAKKMNAKGFDFKNTSEIMDEITKVTPSYAGISYDRIDKIGLQWPCPKKEHNGTQYLHKDKFARGKGRFIPLQYKPSAELPNEGYPLVLTTDRSLYHFHTGTMTRKGGLKELMKEELVEMNLDDAAKLRIEEGDMVKVSSKRGEVKAKAKISKEMAPGVVSMTFHFFESPTNVLTNAALDPVSKIPETKVCAVKVEKCH